MKLLKNELKVFGSACDATEDLFVVLDEFFYVQFINNFSEQVLLKHKNDSLEGKLFTDYLKKNDLPLFLDDCIKLKHSNPIKLNDFFIRWKVYVGTLDGLKAFFLVGKNVTEQEKIYLGIEEECRKIMGHDFPKRLSIQQYINEINNYLTSIINKIPCYVYWKSKDLKYLGCNELGAKFLNLSSSAEIIGKTDLEIFSNKALAESYREDDRKILTSKKATLNQPGELINDKGELSHTLVSKVPLTNEYNEILGIVGISLDITELKETQKELMIAKEKAEAANYIMTEFISNMGHMFVTPISTITSVASMLLYGYADRYLELKPLFEELMQGCTAWEKVYRQVINATSLAEMEVKLESFSINQELNNIVSIMEPAAEAKNLSLIFKPFKPKNQDLIETDRVKFHLIIVELIANAIKFTEKGQITITIFAVDNFYNVQVKDTGIGIPSDKLSYIFEQYTMLSRAQKYGTNFRGVGAGLFLAKQRAKLIDGRILVKSKENHSSTFTLSLPRVVVKALKNPQTKN